MFLLACSVSHLYGAKENPLCTHGGGKDRVSLPFGRLHVTSVVPFCKDISSFTCLSQKAMGRGGREKEYFCVKTKNSLMPQILL